MNNPWNVIEPPQSDVSARRVDHTHTLDLFWARDHLGRYLFVYEMTPEDAPQRIELPSLMGIQAVYVPASRHLSQTRLVLVLNDKSNWELFLALCNDLIQATRFSQDTRSAVNIIVRRLTRWQEFLRRRPNDLLTEDRIKGLIGEMLFMKLHLAPKFGPSMAVQFWQGPEGLPQDFNIGDSAVEVKCRSGATTPYVTIRSADQLCPQLSEMYLFVVTLGKTIPEAQDAVNLPNLVSEMRDLLQADGSDKIERFTDLLHMVGYVDTDRYLEFSYVLSSAAMYRVVDGFPRICPEEIHRGIIRLSYDIRLAECDPFLGQPDWMGAIP